MNYYVHSTPEKVYIEEPELGCAARLCEISGEFYSLNDQTPYIAIQGCSFEQFKTEAAKRGFVVEDEHAPDWSKRGGA
jgi:hypothetical protein